MSQIRTNHVTYPFIVSDFNRQATTILDEGSATYIKEGEVVLANLDGSVVTGTGSTYAKDKMRIVFRTNEGLLRSPVIKASNVTGYKVTPYSAATNKVIYIGYNGTSGDIEGNSYTAGTTYVVNIDKKGILDHFLDNRTFHKSFSYYYSSASKTRLDVIRGLVKNGVDNFNSNNKVDAFIKVEAVSSDSSGAASSTVSFVNGSKVAIASGAGHGITACDFIRPCGSGTTNAIYYVKSVDGTTINLEVPYQGDSDTLTPHILSSPSTADFGLKITGREKKFDSINNKFRFDVADFSATLKYFDDTEVTVDTAASLGTGDWREVAELEWEAQDMWGQHSHTDWLMPSRKRYFEEDNTYDMLVLEAYDDRHDSLAGTPRSKFTIMVAIPTTSTDQGDNAGAGSVASGIATALDSWLTANTSTTYNEDANLT